MVSIVFSDPVPGVLPHRILKSAILGKRAAFMAWMRDHRPLAGVFSARGALGALSTAALTWIKGKISTVTFAVSYNRRGESASSVARAPGRNCPSPTRPDRSHAASARAAFNSRLGARQGRALALHDITQSNC